MTTSEIGAKARGRNPRLEPLAFLIGAWRTSGTHPMLPGQRLTGRTAFEWHEGGAFIIMRSEVDEPRFPDGLAIIGSDDRGRFAMTYFDERGVSRLSDVEVGEDSVTWRRDDPDLAQSLTITKVGADRLMSKGWMSEKGGPWTDDLSQEFSRCD